MTDFTAVSIAAELAGNQNPAMAEPGQLHKTQTYRQVQTGTHQDQHGKAVVPQVTCQRTGKFSNGFDHLFIYEYVRKKREERELVKDSRLRWNDELLIT